MYSFINKLLQQFAIFKLIASCMLFIRILVLHAINKSV